MRVELVWSPEQGDVRHVWLEVGEGANVEHALRSCAEFTDQLPGLSQLKIGVWGRVRPLDTLLRDRDRIEVYRPLKVDPMDARRERYKAKGERIVSRHRPLAGKTNS